MAAPRSNRKSQKEALRESIEIILELIDRLDKSTLMRSQTWLKSFPDETRLTS